MANREFNNAKINVEFEETANRQQINSGESVNTMFGKIKKFLSDLKPVAFTGKFSDLEDVPKYTPKESGLYNITVDEYGNVISATPVTKEDIINLGVVYGFVFEIGDDGNLYVTPKEN